MFNSCGNSSDLDFLKNLPKDVIRSSLFKVTDSSELLTTIDLNLNIEKGVHRYPIRVCLKNTGPGIVNFIPKAIIKKYGNSSNNEIDDKQMSNNRFNMSLGVMNLILTAK